MIFDSQQQWQGRLAAGAYEIQYRITVPSFDIDTLFRTIDGRRVGPWDYSHEAHNYGQCLLPEIGLWLDGASIGHCRTCIPDEIQLAGRQFTGYIGFEIDEPREVHLALTCDHANCHWEAIDLNRLPRPEFVNPIAVQHPPRYLLTAQLEQRLRESWQQRDDCAAFDRLLKLADEQPVPGDLHAARQFTTSLQQQGYRDPFLIMPGMITALHALRYLALGRDADLQQLTRWLETLALDAYWAYFDQEPSYRFQSELVYYFTHFGALAARSWCGDALSRELTARLDRRIAHNTDRIYRFIVMGRSTWSGAVFQNHAFFALSTLVFSAVSLPIEHDPRRKWGRQAVAMLEQITAHLPGDGSYFEGPCYANFSLHGLLPALWLLEQVTDEPTWAPRHWLGAHWSFTEAMVPPTPDRNLPMDDADETGEMSWLPAALWQARDTHSSLATRETAARVANMLSPQLADGTRSIMPLLWSLLIAPDHGESVVEPTDAPASAAPRLHWAPEMGLASARLQPRAQGYFITGPHMGHTIAPLRPHPYNFAHAHPDRGNVLLAVDGHWLLADTGYVHQKRSDEHNVLTVDGQGQHNDGWVWMQPPVNCDFQPPRASVHQDDDRLQVEVDLAAYYPQDRGLIAWLRQVEFCIGQGMIVRDRVMLDRSRRIAFRWGSAHPWTIHACESSLVHEATVSLPGQQQPALRLLAMARDMTMQAAAVHPVRRYAAPDRPWHALELTWPEPRQAVELVSVFALTSADEQPRHMDEAITWSRRRWTLQAHYSPLDSVQ